MSAVREQEPLVQCLTNSVVMDITANVLLAIGASPAMCDTPSESADFAAVASGVLVNAGTPSYEQYAGMRAAVAGATAAGTPWVLDPVACGGLTERTRFQRSIALEKPSAIRGNASEIIALANLDENAAASAALIRPMPRMRRSPQPAYWLRAPVGWWGFPAPPISSSRRAASRASPAGIRSCRR